MGVDGSACVSGLFVGEPWRSASSVPVDATLEVVYRRYFGGLMRVAFLMTGSNAVAEDLVHDVFVRCAGRLSRLEDPGSYLRASVVNACRRHHRRERRQADRAVSVSEPEPSTADAVAVRRALMSMPPRRRAAVVLRFYEDLAYDDIAATLGCRPSTARSLVHRGLEELRGELHER